MINLKTAKETQTPPALLCTKVPKCRAFVSENVRVPNAPNSTDVQKFIDKVLPFYYSITTAY